MFSNPHIRWFGGLFVCVSLVLCQLGPLGILGLFFGLLLDLGGWWASWNRFFLGQLGYPYSCSALVEWNWSWNWRWRQCWVEFCYRSIEEIYQLNA